ncbi:hypothetical protein G6011_07254 [Alternaria panax]|uniref:Uncharacterized protein n=1 Tax=Alternaria panax TaxID=48097 RepID=A0AAD4I4Y2_9PLEO|nr:hypothetical protein G6011_07254 [Alternaria panax]
MSLEAWEEETRLAEEELRFGKPSRHIISNMQAIGTAMPVVRLPVTPEQHKKLGPPTCIAKRGEHIAMHEPALLSLQFPPLGVQYDEERQPEWSQTRMPWFDRRDDAPFRGPGQTPYAQVMVFSPGAPTLATHSVHLNSEHSMEGAIAAS